jgi:hypothetical protein
MPGRVMVADFGGNAPAQVPYWKNWGDVALLDGWHDPEDLQLPQPLLRDPVLTACTCFATPRVGVACSRSRHPHGRRVPGAQRPGVHAADVHTRDA